MRRNMEKRKVYVWTIQGEPRAISYFKRDLEKSVRDACSLDKSWKVEGPFYLVPTEE